MAEPFGQKPTLATAKTPDEFAEALVTGADEYTRDYGESKLEEPPGPPVEMVDLQGNPITVPANEVDAAIGEGYYQPGQAGGDLTGVPGTGMWGGFAPMSPQPGKMMGETSGAPPPTPEQSPTAVPVGPPQFAQPASFGGGGGGYGKLPPIPPQYFDPGYVDQLHTGARDALDKLAERYGAGEISEEEFEKGIDSIEGDRQQKLTAYQQWEQSIPGQQVGLVRAQLDAQGRQNEFGAQAQGVNEWAMGVQGAQMRAARRDYEKAHAEYAARRQRVERDVDTKMAEYKQAIDDVSKSNIDPDKFWEDRGGLPAKIMGAIAMGLGAAGAALARTPNFAAQIIEGAIERDIDAQKANLQKKKDTVSLKGNLVGMMRQKLGDLDASAAAAKAHIYATLEQRMALTANSAQRKTVRIKADAMRQQFADRKQLAEQELKLQATVQAKMLEQQRMMMIAGARAARARAAANAENLARHGAYGVWDKLPQGAEFIQGVGIALQGGKADEARGRLQSLKEAQGLIAGALGPNSEYNLRDRASVESLMSQLQIKINKAGGLGALDAGTQEVLKGITGDPNAIISLDDPKVKLQQLHRQMAVEADNTAKSLGVVPAQQTIEYDEKGNPKVRFYLQGNVQDYAATAPKQQ